MKRLKKKQKCCSKKVWFTRVRHEQENIPVGCLTPTWQPYVFWWQPLDVSTRGGEGGLGPQVNKFE